jgi:hypothetical protein
MSLTIFLYYGIDPHSPERQQVVIEIAKQAAQQNGSQLCEHIQKYGINASTPESLQGLIEIAEPVALADDHKTVAISLFENFNWFLTIASLCTSRHDLKRLFKEMPSIFEKISTFTTELRIRLSKELIASACEANPQYLIKLKTELFKEPYSLNKKIVVLPIDLRTVMIEFFLRGCRLPYANTWDNLKKESDDIVHAQLPCLILARYPAQGEQIYKTVIQKIKTDRELRISDNQQVLLECLINIIARLNDPSKIALLKQMFDIPLKDQQKAFRLILDILNFNGEEYLHEVSDISSLKLAQEKLFADKCQINLDNFSTLFVNTVDKWRSKGALITFASKQISNPNVLPYFKKFLISVLQGQFQMV